MSCFRVLCLEFIALYMAVWASGDTDDKDIPPSYTQAYNATGYDYNPRDVYEPMTAEFKPIHTGTIDLPPCIKNLLNCWEMLNPDVVCKFNASPWPHPDQARFDTVCMDLRFQCREYNGPQPFPFGRINLLSKKQLLDLCGQSKFIHTWLWYKFNGNAALSAGKE